MKRLLVLSLAVVVVAANAADSQKLLDRLSDKMSDSQRMLLAVTPEDEVRVGQQVSANLLGVAPLVSDDGLQRYVNTVGRWVASHSERPDLPWRFGVIESADVNAFAAPGGYILITRGLYASLSDESELAGVLGHEIAHVVQKHHIEIMRKAALVEEGRQAVDRRIKDKDELIKRLVGNGAEIFARRLDQDAEFEADRRGIVYAVRAGYAPFGLPAVLQKLGSVGASDDRMQLLFKTHPMPAERLQRLDSAAGAVLIKYERSSAGGPLYSLR